MTTTETRLRADLDAAEARIRFLTTQLADAQRTLAAIPDWALPEPVPPQPAPTGITGRVMPLWHGLGATTDPAQAGADSETTLTIPLPRIAA